MKTINIKQLENLKAKDGKVKKLSEGITGLMVRAYPTGRKIFFVRVRCNKQDIIQKIGEFPFMSLQEARAKAQEMKNKAAYSKKPKDALTEKSLDDYLVEWIDKRAKETEARGKDYIKEAQRLERYILPKLKDKPVDDLEYTDLLEMLEPIEKQGKIATLQKVKGMLLNFLLDLTDQGQELNFSVAEARERLRRTLHKANRKIHYATLTKEADVINFFGNLQKLVSPKMRALILFHAYTLVRPGELRQAEWQEIDFDKALWTIPARKMKMKREHQVPLSRQAMEILTTMQGISYNSKFIFPQDNNLDKPISNNTERLAIQKACKALSLPPMVSHGIRAMASTALNAKGFNADVIEAALAHSADTTNPIRSAYNHHEYLDERREMLQEWSNYIEELTK